MKELNLLIWLTQLGLSVAVPLAGFILLAVWLHNTWGWGKWVIVAGVILGIASAISSFRSTMGILNRMAKDKKEAQDPGLSFNEHD